MTPGELARVLPKIERIPFSTCWHWTGAPAGVGYAQVQREGTGRLELIHRVVYEHYRGPIPSGLVIDHLCRNRNCVNPDHLDPVTMRVNLLRGESFSGKNARKTHCDHGHALVGENLRISVRGSRLCRACLRALRKKYRGWQ